MNRIKNGIIIVTFVLVCSGSVQGAELLHHWTLNETSGLVAADSVGDLDLTLENFADTTSHWVAGRYGGGLQFDGVDDYAFNATGTAPFTTPVDHTVALWIKYDAENVGRIQRWLSWGGQDDTGTWGRYYMGIHSAGDFSVGIGAGTVKTETSIEPPSSIAFEHWAAVYASGELTIYRNGLEVPIASSNISGSVHPISTTLPFVLGRLGLSYPADTARWTDATFDDVAIWDVALTQDEIKEVMKGFRPELASAPMPDDQFADVPRSVVLNWAAGEYAVKHDVYFGIDFDAVNEAEIDSNLLISQGQVGTTLDIGVLEFGQTYYWRVDEVNGAPDNTVFNGNTWSFTVEPKSISIPGSTISVTASSVGNEFSMPERTIDGSGLDANDMHAITPETMWFTVVTDLDPWIQYEFDTVKKLDVMTVWNSNSFPEKAIGYGVKDVEIATSVDGETWDVLPDVNQFSRAPGLPTYDQFDEIDFGGAAAKYVRLNIQSNWGGVLISYGLSEVQFSMIPVRVRTPEPESGAVDLALDTSVTWRAGRNVDHHVIYVDTDMNAVADGTTPSVTSITNSLDMTSLDLQLGQTYYWRVDEVNDAEAVPAWAGPVWSFSTVDALIVDDFEGYGNKSPNRSFQTWLDGIGYSADEFFPVAYGGNGTGAAIGHDIWSVASPHYNGTIMETSNTLPGSGQSMPFYYTNTGDAASETQRTFAVPQDWTIGKPKTLSIAFNGQVGNTGTMFVLINNVKVTYDRDNGNISRGAWQAWNIDLATVNTTLSNITKLTLGVEGAGTSGMILFDDIRLYPKAGEMITPMDPGANGLVGAWSFDEGSGAVAADSSGNNRNGTIVDATWDMGKQGSALNFNGVSSYVNINGFKGINAIDAVQQAFTISNWIKTTAGEGEMVTWGTKAGGKKLTWRINENTLRTEHDAGNLRGNTPVNDDEWHHVALVVTEGANLRVPATQIYLDGQPDGTFSGNDAPYELAPDLDVRIGMSGPEAGRFFMGLIDEVVLYDRALTDVELLWLAGRTEPFDKPF